ncbi:MAG: hypothetical protein K6E85_06725 [Lachnospiraceae bacterium]|nr:hypothetical protein [Lachnospiraceae bacterium]
MKLCIGTFFTLLALCKLRKTRMRDLTSKLIMGLDKDFVETDDDSGLSAVRRGARGLSVKAVEAARKEDPNKLAKYFDENIISILEAEKKDIIVLAIIDMLQKDSEIPLDMDVDRYSGMTKESVISCKRFVLPNFLAGIYLYVASDRSYKGVENYVKQVNNSYLEMLSDREGLIEVERRRSDLRRVNSEFAVNKTIYNTFNTYVFTAAIVGIWDENYAGDKEVIELLAGTDYETFIGTIRDLFGNSALQMDYHDGCWSFVAREDYLKKNVLSILDAVLQKAQKATHMLCAEKKPCYELPSQQRWCAAAFGKKNYYSDVLRKGMAEFWSYIGNNKSVLPSCNPNTVSNLYYKILQDIFSREDWRIIEGAKVMMSLLAEGDPDAFLHSVGKNIAKKNSSIVACLNEFENGITRTQYGTELIFAVDLLARYEKYFQQATVILFELSKYSGIARERLEQVLYPGSPLITIKREMKTGLLKGLFLKTKTALGKCICRHCH